MRDCTEFDSSQAQRKFINMYRGLKYRRRGFENIASYIVYFRK